MSVVTIRIPQPLRKLTEGKDHIELQGNSVKEILNNLTGQFPGIQDRLLDESGNLRKFVNVYLNNEDIRFLQNLDTPIKEGDELSILPAIAGG